MDEMKKVTQRIYEEVKKKLEYGDFISTKGRCENYYIHVRLEEPVKDVNQI